MIGLVVDVGDGADASEISGAVSAVSAAGGGTVRLARNGTYGPFSTSVRLKDNVTLDGRWSTIYQDPEAEAFRLIVNDDTTNGNSGIALTRLYLDGGRQNLTTPRPWAADRVYARGQEVINQAGLAIYRCIRGGKSGSEIPSGTADYIRDGSVRWAYVCPLWVPGADLVYLTKCRDSSVTAAVRNSRNNGVIIEGGVDVDGENPCNNIVVHVSAYDCNKGGVYLSSARGVTGRIRAARHFMGVAVACTRGSRLTVWARDNTYANGLLLGRDTQDCAFICDVDGINTAVEHISSAPLALHGHVYPDNPLLVYGITGCTITGIVRRGVVALRKSFENTLTGLRMETAGAADDVSSPHAIDLQGSSRNTITGFWAYDTHETGYGVALEPYVDADGSTLTSNDNVIEYGKITDNRAPKTSLGVGVVDGCAGNIVRHNRSEVPYVFLDVSTVDEDNEIV